MLSEKIKAGQYALYALLRKRRKKRRRNLAFGSYSSRLLYSYKTLIKWVNGAAKILSRPRTNHPPIPNMTEAGEDESTQ